MSKFLLPLNILFVVILCLIPAKSYGQVSSRVADTPHNLRKATQGAMADLGVRDYGDVCVYCHIQHDATASSRKQMWNRIFPTSVYVMHDSPPATERVSATPDSISLVCLSCHDGTQPLDAVKKVPSDYSAIGSSNARIGSCSDVCHTESNPSGGLIFKAGNMGTDLRNHHPIAVSQDASRNTKLQAATGGQVNGLPLYGPNSSEVGCATCHDPHDNSQTPFLRISNQNGQLCLACHEI